MAYMNAISLLVNYLVHSIKNKLTAECSMKHQIVLYQDYEDQLVYRLLRRSVAIVAPAWIPCCAAVYKVSRELQDDRLGTARLLHSPKLVSVGLCDGCKTWPSTPASPAGLKLTGIPGVTVNLLVGLNIGWECLSCSTCAWPMGISIVFKCHSQSPCTDQTTNRMHVHVVMTVQGDCGRV